MTPRDPVAAYRVLVVMGVSGAGKTTIGSMLSAALGWDFQEGDALHPAANVAKMSRGIPLDDTDRWPWLDAVASWIDRELAAGRRGVITCSALKRVYRARIIGDRSAVGLVFLEGAPALIAERLAGRKGHFMPPSLLESQFAALEPPGPAERPVAIDVARPPADAVARIVERIGPDDGLNATGPIRSAD